MIIDTNQAVRPYNPFIDFSTPNSCKFFFLFQINDSIRAQQQGKAVLNTSTYLLADMSDECV